MSSNSSDGIEFYSLPKIDNVTLRINQYPIQLVPTGFPTGIKRLERQTDHSPYLRLVDNECILILRHHIRLRYYAQGRINWTFIPRSTCLKFTNYIIQDYTHTHTKVPHYSSPQSYCHGWIITKHSHNSSALCTSAVEEKNCSTKFSSRITAHYREQNNAGEGLFWDTRHTKLATAN